MVDGKDGDSDQPKSHVIDQCLNARGKEDESLHNVAILRVTMRGTRRAETPELKYPRRPFRSCDAAFLQ